MPSPKNFNAMLTEQSTETTEYYTNINMEDRIATYYQVTIKNVALKKYVGQL
jgi:hypothetical protein